jgi:uncharacterized protein YecE (DUF72 family)
MADKPGGVVRIGTAGWSIPAALADRMPGDGSRLQRYAAWFNATEINSCFHRPHRRSTYQRWAESVGPDFSFAVKLPRTITHEQRLLACDDHIARFAGEVDGLGSKRGPVLVQLPPSLAFDALAAEAFFVELARILPGAIVCEPRHESWVSTEAEALLLGLGVARVAADPARVARLAEPGGRRDLAYFRLHGSPRPYWSAYGPEAAARHADRLAALRADAVDSWTIYDNTASGAATADALALHDRLGA